MIELKILLDEVDYRSLSEVLIPALAESMAKDGGVLGGMLSQNRELAASMARTVLDKMPQEKKDELLVQLLNRNRDKAGPWPPRRACASSYATCPPENSNP